MLPKIRKNCSVKGCKNTQRTPGVTLFRFPKDEERCSAWLKNCGRTDLTRFSPHHLYNNYKICSDHFQKETFAGEIGYLSKRKLKRTAVPKCIPPDMGILDVTREYYDSASIDYAEEITIQSELCSAESCQGPSLEISQETVDITGESDNDSNDTSGNIRNNDYVGGYQEIISESAPNPEVNFQDFYAEVSEETEAFRISPTSKGSTTTFASDLSRDDITLERAKQMLQHSNDTIRKQNLKIKQLQQQGRQFRSKIKYLNSLLQRLAEAECKISE